MSTINTTTLARRFGVTTKALESRLRKLGIAPAQEMIQPSGKRFVLWPAEEAVTELEKYKADKLDGKVPRQPRSFPIDTSATDKLQSEVQELKIMVTALLEEMKRRT